MPTCSRCDADFNDAKYFCPSCGQEIAQDNQNNDFVPISEIKQPVKTTTIHEPLYAQIVNGMPMKWFNIFVRFILPAAFVLIPLSYLSTLSNSLGDSDTGSLLAFYTDPMLGIANILNLLYLLAYATMAFLARGRLKRFEKSGYRFIMWMLVLGIGLNIFALATEFISLMLYYRMSFGDLLQIEEIRDYLSEITSGIIFAAIPGTLNIIYFYKRRHLFIN